MPRTRAYRRHKRHVKLQRRYRLVVALLDYPRLPGPIEEGRDRGEPWESPKPRWMHSHLNGDCWDLEGPGPEELL